MHSTSESTATAALATTTQQHLWLFDRFYAHDATYNIAFGLRLVGPIDAAILQASLQAIVDRHEALRTTFAEDGDELLQIIQAELRLDLPTVAIAEVAGPDATARMLARLRDDATQPFDLARGPLLRATLYTLGPDEAVLSVVVHHIIFDGWSLGVFVQELGRIYSARLAGQDDALPELPIQFADFAEWQRQQLATPEAAASLEYWRGQLAGAPRQIDLPTDRPRRSGMSRRGLMVRRDASPTLRAAIMSLARREHVTPFTVYMAAFAVLIGRHARQRDLLIATPIAGRSREELEPLIGFFVKTVLVRATLRDDQPFRDLLARMSATVVDALHHQDTPLDQINQLMTSGGGSGQAPMLQVMLALQSATPDIQPFAGHPASLVWAHNGTAKYDFFLNVVDEAGQLRYELEFDADLFEEDTADRWLERFERLLAAASADASQSVDRLPMTTGRDADVIDRANETRVEWPARSSVVELFDEQAARTPDRVAVQRGDDRLTYRQLAERSSALACVLAAAGAGPDAIVAIEMERTTALLVAIMAIWKAGAAYLPLDPDFPAARLDFMLEDSGAQLLVTDTRRVGTPRHVATTIDIATAVAPVGAPIPSPRRQPDDLAYVIYTSGSTGKPKGVEVSQRALLNFVQSMAREPGLTERDVVVAITTLSFDIAALELYVPLIVGGRIELATREEATDGARLRQRLEDTGATLLQATPTTWRILLEAGWSGSSRIRALCGGEPFPPDLADRLLPICGEVWNMYGPTETTVWSTVARLEPNQPITIGHAIANTTVRVLDAAGNRVPVGVPGELHIGGAGVARGYHGRPELTAARFIPDPSAATPGARLYRTGDLARWRADGTLECLGRIDQQIKLRGFRIELGEIEAALEDHPSVAQAAAAVFERPGGAVLAAYVTPTPGSTVEFDALDRHLREQLPAYMVPTFLDALDTLPLTPNGKIDRRALPEPTARRERTAFEPPATETERRLAVIWSGLLGSESIDRRDDFFALGGHSLLAAQLLSRVQHQFGIGLSPAALFTDPTLTDLAAHIDRSSGAAPPLDDPSSHRTIVQLERGGDAPPLFWVHGLGGEVFSYQAVSRHLAAARSVYGFAADWKQRFGQHVTLENVAAEYVDELIAARPTGPLHLAGYCAGAVLAVEMARQLRLRGRTTGAVIAVDFDMRRSSSLSRPLAMLRNLPVWIRDDAMTVSLRELRNRAVSRLRFTWHNFVGRLFGREKRTDIRDRLGMWRLPDYQVGMIELHHEVFGRHVPKPVAAPVTLILARTMPIAGPFPAGAHTYWTALSDRLEVEQIPGSHSSILVEPYARKLAERLTEALRRAEDEATRAPRP